MGIERTLSIIKPDGVGADKIGAVLQRFELAGLKITAMRMIRLEKREAQSFYAVHRERPFFDSLTTFMSSGPIVVSVLEGEDAIMRNRDIMGATNPAEAAEGTIRRDFATEIEKNFVHGSDGPDTAREEIGFFFSEFDVIGGQRS